MQSNITFATTTSPVATFMHTSTTCTIEPTAKTTASVTGIIYPNMTTEYRPENYSLDPYVQIIVSVPLPASCSQYAECLFRIEPNPDISGLGVVTAFLVSAYLVLAMLMVAYWLAVLPKDLVRRADRQLFFVRSTEPDEKWRRTFEEIVLIFSDQQLLTGFGVLIAGYIQVVNASLSAYHWKNIVYLAWLSSTVHLMSLSVLREHLKRSKVTLAIRLCAILLVFVLLIAALWPMAMFPWNSTMPVRCLWKVRADSISEVDYTINTSVSYFTLVGTFVWKLSQFSDRTRGWIRYRGRASWECALEKAARQLLLAKRPTIWTKTRYRLLTTFYIALVAHLELLESFMFTITLLTYTLAWGTLNLVQRGKYMGSKFNAVEREMGFGQILALLLLAQPVLAALDTLKRQQKLPALTGIASSTSVFQDYSIARSRTLSDVLASSQSCLLTAAEKATNDLRDPVIDHLYRSRGFKGFIVALHLSLLAVLAVFLMLSGVLISKTSEFYSLSVLPILSIVPVVPICFSISIMLWSKRLV